MTDCASRRRINVALDAPSARQIPYSRVLQHCATDDPVTFVTAVGALALVAAMATWLPAWRTTRLDPLVALRYD
jgi:hypothetical protein